MAESAALERAKDCFRQVLSDGDSTMDELRERYDRMCAQFEIPDEAEIEAIDAAGVPCLRVRMPGVSQSRMVVYTHGGGYVMGCASGYRSFGCDLSRAADAQVLLVDYRLAPENPYPAAVEDAVAAFKWATAQSDVAYIAAMGDSAGAGLAVAACLVLRDAGGKMPDACVCISPFVDLAGEGESLARQEAVDPVASRAAVAGMAGAYLNGADPKATPLASPIYADDLSGLPPTQILVGSVEGLVDDSYRLERKLREGGGQPELIVAEDMIHIWPLFSSFLPEAREAVGQMGEFLRRNA